MASKVIQLVAPYKLDVAVHEFRQLIVEMTCAISKFTDTMKKIEDKTLSLLTVSKDDFLNTVAELDQKIFELSEISRDITKFRVNIKHTSSKIITARSYNLNIQGEGLLEDPGLCPNGCGIMTFEELGQHIRQFHPREKLLNVKLLSIPITVNHGQGEHCV